MDLSGLDVVSLLLYALALGAAITSQLRLRRLGKALGLRSSWLGGRLTGEIDGVGVTIGARPDLSVLLDAGLALDLSIEANGQTSQNSNQLRMRGWPRPLASRRSEARVQLTGDREFDTAVRVFGAPDEVAALMTAELRRQLRDEVVEHGTLVHAGLLWGSLGRDRGDAEVLGRLAALARRLVKPGEDIAARLRAQVADDPVAGARQHCLELLQDAGHDHAMETSRVALKDPDAAVRLSAASYLGEEGYPAAVALLDDPDVAVAVKVRALDALAQRYSERAPALLEGALSRGEPRLVRTAIRLAVATAETPLLERLTELAPRFDADTLLVAVDVLGDRAASLEGAILERFESGLERATLLRALGRVGTPRSLERLARFDWGGDRESQLVRATMARIRTRCRVAPGRLSVVEDGRAGGLSSPEGAGDLSLVARPQEGPDGSR